MITLLLSFSLLSFNLPKERVTLTDKAETLNTAYVTAESGLLCRGKPNGKVIHKFAYGTEVEIIDYTDIELIITDNGEEISGNWVEVRIGTTHMTGFVFDGFLSSDTYYDLDIEKIAKLTPAHFVETFNKKGLLLNGTHTVYDKDLNSINQIILNSISEINIISVTKFERPKTKEKAKRKEWQEYCEWANYVKIKYNNQILILFGAKVLEIGSKKAFEFDNKNIHFIIAKSFLKKTGTLTEELSGCSYSNSFLIEANNNYSLVSDYESENNYNLSLAEDEGGYEELTDVVIKKDTIFSKVKQGFQEGTGEYKLKFFESNGWKFIAYDTIRDYEGQW